MMTMMSLIAMMTTVRAVAADEDADNDGASAGHMMTTMVMAP